MIVVPEAECIERQPEALLAKYPRQVWIGDLAAKGLLVVARDGYALEVDDAYNPSHRYVLPLRVTGDRELLLIAVWTQRDKAGTYTQHLARALEQYEALLAHDAVIVGDFNANTIWDHEHRRDITHSQNVAWLHDCKMASAYHACTDEAQGGESTATHAFRRNPGNTFHIDYAFVSEDFLESGVRLTVPQVAEWLERSDHGPLVLDLGTEGKGARS